MGLSGRFGALSQAPIKSVALAYGTSALGGSFSLVGLSFAAYTITHSATAIGIVLTTKIVAGLLVTLVGGAVADRYPRSRVMAISDIASALTIAGCALIVLVDVRQLWLLAVLVGLAGVAQAFFRPATVALVRELVPKQQLQSVNAALFMVSSTSQVVGPGLAGLVIAQVGAGPGLLIDAASFLGSAAFLSRIPRSTQKAAPFSFASLHEDISGGLRYVWRTSWLRATILQMAVFQGAVLGLINTLGPTTLYRTSAGVAGWGTVLTAFTAGTLLGGYVGGAWYPRRMLLASMLPALLALPSMLVLAHGGPLIALIIGHFLMGAGIVFASSVYLATLQQEVPDGMMSRVFAIDLVGSSALYPIGLIAAGPLASAVGQTTTFLIGSAVIVAATAAVCALPDVRRLERADEDHQQVEAQDTDVAEAVATEAADQRSRAPSEPGAAKSSTTRSSTARTSSAE